MCGHCGCGETHEHADGTRHSHPHHHDHGHHHGHDHATTLVELQTRVLAKNDALAARNRAWFAGREILALNLMSSPGAGKTTLLERTIRDLRGARDIGVLEGDQATSLDGDRIRAAGAPVVQVNTGTGCHLEADMVMRGLSELRPPARSVVMIENVGNLVCPASYDLGEEAKIVLLSVTEGEDKPLKYPSIFHKSSLLILTKVDLLPYVPFDIEAAEANARQVNPNIEILRVSCATGEGMERWRHWIANRRSASRRQSAAERVTVL